jgi:hypothetical protein
VQVLNGFEREQLVAARPACLAPRLLHPRRVARAVAHSNGSAELVFVVVAT